MSDEFPGFAKYLSAREWAAEQIPIEFYRAKGINEEEGLAFVEINGNPEDFPDLPKKAPNGVPIEYHFFPPETK